MRFAKFARNNSRGAAHIMTKITIGKVHEIVQNPGFCVQIFVRHRPRGLTKRTKNATIGTARRYDTAKSEMGEKV